MVGGAQSESVQDGASAIVGGGYAVVGGAQSEFKQGGAPAAVGRAGCSG